MPTISRRGLILGSASAASLAFAFPLSAGMGDTITVEQFRALSARLTGASLGDLDMGAAAKLLAGFISMGVAGRSRPPRRRSWGKCWDTGDRHRRRLVFGPL